MIKKFFKKSKRSLQAGFSLLEMVMVLSIFAILTAVVTYNYGAFNNQMTLTNLAYEIAMQVREKQVYSLGVRSSSNTFDNRYGIYFKKGETSFLNFIDSDNNGKCNMLADQNTLCTSNCPGGSECQDSKSLPRNMKIEDIKVSGTSTNNPVFITFKRPDTEAIIINGSGPALTSGQVEIIIVSPDNQRKKIIVKQNGYISVENYE